MLKNQIENVVIVGGTHGNEFTGAYLAKYWLQNPKFVKRDSFKTDVIFANQKAFKEVRRYIDRDLNRSCSKTILNTDSILHEELLAKDINTQINGADFVVDLHTTTANMGLSLVVSNDSELTWLSVSYLSDKFPDLKIYRWQGDEEGAFVDSLGKNGFAIEVGSVPQGVLRADLYEKTKKIVYALLDFLDSDIEVIREVEIYDHISLVDYPRDECGELIAMVHPDRQDMDFKEINSGDAMFLTFDGKTVKYNDIEPLYGLFINEAAYYEKGFAMCLAKKVNHKF
jgi:aspartoacylase